MKNIIISIAVATASLTACNTNSDKSQEVKTDTSNVNTPSSNSGEKNTSSVKEITTHYLHVKNALANDNAKEAANGGKAFVDAMTKIDEASLTADQKKTYDDIKEDMKEHADHINKNSDKIDHQREHFDMLSTDMYDLVKTFGAGQTLYQTHCPMYNNNKGANWLSETKDIKNPYLGKKMSTCGTVKEEIK